MRVATIRLNCDIGCKRGRGIAEIDDEAGGISRLSEPCRPLAGECDEIELVAVVVGECGE